MFRTFATLALVFLISTVTLGADKTITGLQANSRSSGIVVSWQSTDETGVSGYLVERKAGLSGQFIALQTVTPKGSNQQYEYADNTVFRTNDNIYQYRITVLGKSEEPYLVSVLHSVSSVRRTWGSIKAMFR
jgi:hypothetical protein